MKAEQESFISRQLIRRRSTCRCTILQQCSAALSRTPFCLERVSSLVRPGTIAGDGTIAGGIKFGSIHPYGTRLRRIGAHHFVPALGRLGSGAQIALAAIAPTGQSCDRGDPVEVVPVQVGLNVPVRVAQAGPAQVVPNGPARAVPSDLQFVQNGQAMHGRSGLRLVPSDLIGHRHRVRDRRQGRNRERAIAKRAGLVSKHAHNSVHVRNSKHARSNAHVRNSKRGRGRRLNRHAAVVRINGPARRERNAIAREVFETKFCFQEAQLSELKFGTR